MTVGHEFRQAPANSDRVLPSWRVVLSAWLVVGLLLLIAIGIHAAVTQSSVSHDSGVSAPLAIPRHDPACGAEARAPVSDCSEMQDWGLTLRYSEY